MVEDSFDGIILMTKLVTQNTKLTLELIDVHVRPLDVWNKRAPVQHRVKLSS